MGETVAPLRAPKLDQASRKAIRDGLHYLGLDGMLIRTDRVRADRPFFSGKHCCHGMNIQVITSPDGTIIWTPGSLPGKSHGLTAARIWGILRALDRAGILTLATRATRRGRTDRHAVQGQEQAHIAEAGQPRPRPPPRLRRTRQRPAQVLARPPQPPLLPAQRRTVGKAIAVLQNYELSHG